MADNSLLTAMIPDSVPVNLIDDGVLWIINKAVFHPRGYALAYDPATKELTLMGDGSESWLFGDSDLEDQKFAALNTLLKKATESNKN